MHRPIPALMGMMDATLALLPDCKRCHKRLPTAAAANEAVEHGMVCRPCRKEKLIKRLRAGLPPPAKRPTQRS